MDETTEEEKKQAGLIPALKTTWNGAKGPIAFLAIGFIAGYFFSGKPSKKDAI